MTENENGFYAWIKTQPKRPKRTGGDAAPPKVAEGIAYISAPAQTSNGQHPSPDPKIIKISDGAVTAEQQAHYWAHRDDCCINHSPRPVKKRQEFAGDLLMTEEEFYAWKVGKPDEERPAEVAFGDEYGRLLDEMRVNIAAQEKPLTINPDE